MSWKCNWVVTTCLFGRHFHKDEQGESITPWKTCNYFVVNDKISAYQWKLKFWVTCVSCHELHCFPVLWDFLDEISGDTENCKDLINDICQHLEGVHDSVKEYFPDNHETKLQNHLWVKDPFEVPDRPIGFSVKEYEQLTDIVSDSVLEQLWKPTAFTVLVQHQEKLPRIIRRNSENILSQSFIFARVHSLCRL